jgi:hypothetical protein
MHVVMAVMTRVSTTSHLIAPQLNPHAASSVILGFYLLVFSG